MICLPEIEAAQIKKQDAGTGGSRVATNGKAFRKQFFPKESIDRGLNR